MIVIVRTLFLHLSKRKQQGEIIAHFINYCKVEIGELMTHSSDYQRKGDIYSQFTQFNSTSSNFFEVGKTQP